MKSLKIILRQGKNTLSPYARRKKTRIYIKQGIDVQTMHFQYSLNDRKQEVGQEKVGAQKTHSDCKWRGYSCFLWSEKANKQQDQILVIGL